MKSEEFNYRMLRLNVYCLKQSFWSQNNEINPIDSFLSSLQCMIIYFYPSIKILPPLLLFNRKKMKVHFIVGKVVWREDGQEVTNPRELAEARTTSLDL